MPKTLSGARPPISEGLALIVIVKACEVATLPRSHRNLDRVAAAGAHAAEIDVIEILVPCQFLAGVMRTLGHPLVDLVVVIPATAARLSGAADGLEIAHGTITRVVDAKCLVAIVPVLDAQRHLEIVVAGRTRPDDPLDIEPLILGIPLTGLLAGSGGLAWILSGTGQHLLQQILWVELR